MLTIQRLNLDTSWKLNLGGTRVLLDPWLTGFEVDGFAAFNKQWHRTAPASFDTANEADWIVVSQPFSDHCHEETIEALAPTLPIAAVPRAYTRLKKRLSTARAMIGIHSTLSEASSVGNIRLTHFAASGIVDRVHNALLIQGPNHENVLYAPHGFVPSESQLKTLQALPIALLITTTSEYHLPFFLGGTVNLGLPALTALCAQLKPRAIVATHDEQKHASGWVPKLAVTRYRDAASVQALFPNFIDVPDYQPHSFAH